MQHLIKAQIADSGIINGLAHTLAAQYHSLQWVPVGQSVCGREIGALTLHCPGQISSTHTIEQVLFCAAFHGQEWLTALVLLRFCEDICFCLQHGLSMVGVDVRRALAKRTIWFIPLINPDGVDIAIGGSETAGDYAASVQSMGGDIPHLWQANARGVDLNHNFDAGFSTWAKNMPTAPAPRRYRGKSPESEPEVRALCELCRRQPFRHVTALHSQGEEIYWHYGEHTPVASRMMAEILASASGYITATPTGSASFGGFKDWFIDTFHRPGFTIELGRGENPLPLSDFEDICTKTREMLLLDAMM